ncbi:MAG: elongation factor G [Polyangiaceae bacterium]|nr:elongation factor G [Polyangiaceae bacterium]
MANGFEPHKIRNVVVVGHKGTGKTTLVEGMLYVGGSTPVLGSVAAKTSVLDDEPEEIAREGTLQTNVAHVVWRDTKINIIDTPGEGSFFGDTRLAMGVADAVILVVSSKDGVQPMTDRLNNWAMELGLPRYLVFSKCDIEHVQLEQTIESVRKRLKLALAPMQVAVGEGTGMKGLVDLLTRKTYMGVPDGPKTKPSDVIPESVKDAVEGARMKLVDEVAATDDLLTEAYLEQGDLSDKEMETGMHKAIAAGTLVPYFFFAGASPYGVIPLLDAIVDVFPAATAKTEVKGRGEEPEVREAKADASLAAFCFKATIDQHAGRNAYVRVMSGTLKGDTYIANGESKERAGGLFNVVGKPVGSALGEVYPGDIVAVTKLKTVKTGDTISEDKKPFVYAAPEVPPALFARVVVLTDRGSGEKIAQGLSKLAEEDNSLKVYHDEQTHDLICAGLSQLHLDVTGERLRRRFGTDITLGPPRIPYLETITRRITNIEGKHKKQTGGHGQFGVCLIDMEPTGRGEGFVFEDAIVGGAIPRNFIPSVEKGIVKNAVRGFLAGYKVVDFKVRLFDGKYHDVDSSDAAFQMAGSKAFKAAMAKAGPILLEPMVKMEITVPTATLGDIMGDLNSRRGRILGSETMDQFSVVNAQAPLVEVLEYEPKLRALTQGTGTYAMTMDRYEPVPSQLQEKIIKDSGFKAVGDDE